jgi:hypothetical protein
MSTSLEQDLKAPSVEERARARLRETGNPFETLAQPNRADDDFVALSLPEFHQRQREQLWRMIDWYRLPEYHEYGNLRPTRAVTIMGDRGAGKTHLLQSLFPRPDRRAQLIVRPTYLEPDLLFEEYLLAQLRITLSQKDEFHADTPLEVIAKTLTRLLLQESVRFTGPLDRLFTMARAPQPSSRLLWGGGERYLLQAERLLSRLENPASANDLPGVLRESGLAGGSACALVGEHLRVTEAGSDPICVVRRVLYRAMAGAVLRGEAAALPQVLREDYLSNTTTEKLPRLDLVPALLQVLIEACALVQMPVVFGFDNLERLLRPLGQFDGELIKAFLHNLAQAIDHTRGVFFLLFAETGLFSGSVVPHMDEFVRARLEQGVPLPDSGPIYQIRLLPPSDKDLVLLVRGRIRNALGDLPGADSLPVNFPFSAEFVADLTGKGSVNLRNILYRLRDEFNHVIYPPSGDGGAGTRPSERVEKPEETDSESKNKAGIDWQQHLETAWQRGLRATRDGLGEFTHHDLHGCLGALLQSLPGLAVSDWALAKVTPTLAVGENFAYGVVTLAEWKRPEAVTLPGPRSLKVGVGFLLAATKGMETDLRAKFDFFIERKKGVRLVVLWLTKNEGALVEALPTNTRKAWDDHATDHWRTELRPVKELDLRRILCFRNLLRDVEEAAGQPPPADELGRFLQNRVSSVLPLLLPSQPTESE